MASHQIIMQVNSYYDAMNDLFIQEAKIKQFLTNKGVVVKIKTKKGERYRNYEDLLKEAAGMGYFDGDSEKEARYTLTRENGNEAKHGFHELCQILKDQNKSLPKECSKAYYVSEQLLPDEDSI